MATAARFISLLISPLPISLLLQRHHRPFLLPLSLLRLSPSLSSPSLSVPRQKLHSLPSPTPSPLSHPWPEWSKFVDSISSFGKVFEGRDGGGNGEDGFVAYEEVSEEFVRVSNACLAFARERSDLLSLLPRRDIEVVVENGIPFLFKSALDTARRMKAFLGMAGDNNVLETEKAQTVDLMKYLLSYASNTVVSLDRGGLYNGELLESSIRNLLSEISRLSGGAAEPDPSMTFNFADRYGQTSRKLRPNIEMKRGDWICSKCNFMNFARNMKCFECEETRPRRQLNGGEWECPQCDFFNYGRNQVCLRCDCKRPSEASFGTNSSSNLAHGNTVYANKPNLEGRLAANEERAQKWFSKISQMDSASDLSSAAADEDFPEIMPLRKGENKFVVSTRKTPLERRLANSQYQRNSSNSLESNEFQNKATSSKGSGSSYIPFVPFPSDMFAKKPLNSKMEEAEITDSLPKKSSEKSISVSGTTVSENSVESLPPEQGERSDKAEEQNKKPESWFTKMAELQGVKDLSTISKEEDFPEIMPMRKGENRFVVSKKKDRSLTSPIYKRKMAAEQVGNTNFVPFVPFPPDYFAKKDKEPSMADTTPKDKTENSSSSIIPNSIENKIDGTRSYPDAGMGNRATGIENLSTGWKRESFENSPSPTTENRQTHIVNSNMGWKGKSLEGSAVVEPDPLDMSEEAKAQRWFRRAAQIKDISELSQIPDEDFPSIMPMRKGVNRFVVSKRKTPLERRLTSPRYKRNLPIVTSDTLKKENDNS